MVNYQWRLPETLQMFPILTHYKNLKYLKEEIIYIYERSIKKMKITFDLCLSSSIRFNFYPDNCPNQAKSLFSFFLQNPLSFDVHW